MYLFLYFIIFIFYYILFYYIYIYIYIYNGKKVSHKASIQIKILVVDPWFSSAFNQLHGVKKSSLVDNHDNKNHRLCV